MPIAETSFIKVYIDIHTHKQHAGTGDEVRVRSLYKDFDGADGAAYYSVGIHPCHLQGHEQGMLALGAVAGAPNILAIGECGLDGLCGERALQREIFEWQIGLAHEYNKPLVIHCVRAFDEVMAMLEAARGSVPVLMHGYNKKMSIALELLERGYYLSFGAAILNEKMPAADVLRAVPADRYFLETDAADVELAALYEKAARVRNTTVDEIIWQVEQNFKAVFRI